MSGMDRLTDEALEQLAQYPGMIAAMARELLAHRRALHAAPAPSDGLREAVEALQFDSNELTGPGNALRGGWMLAIKAVLDLLDGRAASPAQEGGE